ncbi:phosphatase PAP2 family protein [Mucilaginibacter sp. HMF5004]|uniref:phosphatase PAP2 family protein n=1 Tax=Mucilaginibacter rivuli TaxID=2857527 RepID=UPI001C5CF712|nr:phosphatase PAP2 family protein [Mucilaginibacter rivuli]MBW4890809.1 phosphatase PAP2 family protein [Mucilaginibacter rivuli]
MNNSIISVLHKIRFFLYPYLILLIACLAIKAIYSKDVIYYTVNGWHFDFGDVLFDYATYLGDGLIVVLICLIALAYNYRKGFLLASSYLITSIVAQVIKRVMNLPRPIHYFTDTSHMYLVKGVVMLNSLSFPSGHSTSAFSAAVVLTYLTPKKQYGLLFLLLAVMVGYSRMYLSQHFFEDVIGGSAIGVFVTVIWLSWIEKKPFIHSEKWNKGLLSLLGSKK